MLASTPGRSCTDSAEAVASRRSSCPHACATYAEPGSSASARAKSSRAADASRGWLRGVAQLLGAGDDDAGEVALGELVVDDGGDGGGVGREVSRESDPLSPREPRGRGERRRLFSPCSA